jgi:hypothetical protein
MRLDDFVMLGKTVPEPNSDGRVFVCSAGVSPELRSLVRIYPLARHDAPRRWTQCRLEVERNAQDSRHESFKIAGDRSPGAHERINEGFAQWRDVPDHQRPELLRPFALDSIAAANRLQQSLAILHPAWVDLAFDVAAHDDPDSPQLELFDDLPEVAPVRSSARFGIIPRLIFRDAEGEHRLQIRDWGVYELMRKHGEAYARQNLHQALHLRDGSSLLVGNQNNRRTSWLVISVLNGVRAQAGLFDRMASERPFIPVATRRRVLARDHGVCQLCGAPAAVLDHIFPAIRGGVSEPANLQALCTRCNLAKNDQVQV